MKGRLLAVALTSMAVLWSCTENEFIEITQGPELILPAFNQIVTSDDVARDGGVAVSWDPAQTARPGEGLSGYEIMFDNVNVTASGDGIEPIAAEAVSGLGDIPYASFSPNSYGNLRVDAIDDNRIQRYPSLQHRILVTLAQPIQTLPNNGGAVCITSEVLTWEPVADATGYEVRLYAPDSPEARSVLPVEGQNTTSLNIGEVYPLDVLPVGEFEWDVVATLTREVDGDTEIVRGIPSERWNAFVVETIPYPVGMLSSPIKTVGPDYINFESGFTVTLEWQPTIPDNGYEVEVYTGGCGANGDLVFSGQTPAGTTSIDFLFTENELVNGQATTYFWRTRASQVTPCPENEWSACETFELEVCAPPEMPELYAPPVCVGGSSEIRWNPQEGTVYVPEFSWSDNPTWTTPDVVDPVQGLARMEGPFGGQQVTKRLFPTNPLLNVGTGRDRSSLLPVTSDDDCEISDIRLYVELDAPSAGQIYLELISSLGERVPLSAFSGGGGTNFRTLFDSQAPNDIDRAVSADAPFDEPEGWRPSESLFTLNGSNSGGVWQLRIVNNSQVSSAQLLNWWLEFDCPEPGGGSPPGYWRMTVLNECNDDDSAIVGTPRDPSVPGYVGPCDDDPDIDGNNESCGGLVRVDERSVNFEPADIQLTTGVTDDCNVGSSVAITSFPGNDYEVEFWDVVEGAWQPIVFDEDCFEDGAGEIICSTDPILAGSGVGYQWRARSQNPEQCESPWYYTSTFGSQAVPIPWDGTGAFVRSSSTGSGPFNHSGDGDNNDWIVEQMCPAGPWTGVSGMLVGDLVYSHGSAWGSVPSCGGSNFSCGSGCGGPIFPTTFGQSWFTVTKTWFLSSQDAVVNLSLDVVPSPADPVHLDIFVFGSAPPPGPPGDGTFTATTDDDAEITRQACSFSRDAFGCTGSGSDNRECFQLRRGCYTLRVTTVDGTGGTVVTFDADLREPTSGEVTAAGGACPLDEPLVDQKS